MMNSIDMAAISSPMSLVTIFIAVRLILFEIGPAMLRASQARKETVKILDRISAR